MFNKKAFVWLLFKKEMLFMFIGIAIGVILMFLIAKGIIPIPGFNFCPVK